MAATKNTNLDFSEDEDEDMVSDDENDRVTETKLTAKHRRATRRFTLDDDDDSGSDDGEEESGEDGEGHDSEEGWENESEEEEGDEEKGKAPKPKSTPTNTDSRFQLPADEDDGDNDRHDDGREGSRHDAVKKSKKPVKPLTPAALAEFQKALNRTGIVYISRVPPYMKPQKMRNMLEKFGEVGRVYLAPEDAKVAARRKKYGGNKKKNFTEGWVEFKDKKIAKKVALTLNTKPMGGNKRNFYHDDLWNIKYLPKFKWHHLTERIAFENASRQQRLRTEIAQAQRENKAYVANVERSKMVAKMEEKKRGRGRSEGLEEARERTDQVRRTFKQRKLVNREVNEEVAKGVGRGRVDVSEILDNVEPKVKSVLGKVFGGRYDVILENFQSSRFGLSDTSIHPSIHPSIHRNAYSIAYLRHPPSVAPPPPPPHRSTPHHHTTPPHTTPPSIPPQHIVMATFDPNNLPDDEEDIDYSDIEARHQVPYDDGFDTLVVVDNLPIVDETKEEKLLTVVRKIFRSVGEIKEGGIWMPTENSGKKTSKG
ncbi:hypothetical protein BC938DRAFT_473337 [Jimgerdemannia flammicorona]|uniref:18S rRNA factor 2 n=1 Tax=Jimgerdemannia flammicorona TaxID=994334 RepID=A0A433QTH0_9FUNG|nr:hypothetical protein BC938DRAFT_473337 [Jimgerdemannia flammicorona]